MMVDDVNIPMARRLFLFQLRMDINRVNGTGEPVWLDVQESGIHCLMTDDFNNDMPCKYARSRGE